jgi:glucokinase
MGWLVADIGGTNTRCAIAGPGGTVGNIETFRNRDFPGLDRLLAAYLGTLPPRERPDEAVIAIAAPIRGDEIRWSTSTGFHGPRPYPVPEAAVTNE